MADSDSGGEGVSVIPSISRRGFLGAVAVGAGALALPGAAQAMPMPVSPAAATSFVIRRREDMLRLVVDSRDLTIDKARGQISIGGNIPYLRVSFGPQSIIERGEPYGRTGTARPVPARLSGPSHLTFRVMDRIGMSLGALLAWSDRELVIHPLAQAKDGEDVSARNYDKAFDNWVTVIEMPWWLVLSPHREASFTEQLTPKTRDGVTEVFHSRLASGAGENQTEDPAERTLRGIWIRDPQAASLLQSAAASIAEGQPGFPWGRTYDTLLTPRDRADIVRLTTRTGANQLGGPARAVKARVALSPLGGYLDAAGAWNEPGVATLLSWRQRIWQGRDTYTKTVRAGLLYPWGIKAAYVEEGLRVFAADASGLADGVTAFWQVRRSVIVADPDVDLAGDSAGTDAGKRGALFTSIHCRTTQTPPLEEAGNARPAGWRNLLVFTPKITTDDGSQAFLFDLVGTDPDGNAVAFRQPLLFAAVATTGAADADPNFTNAGADALTAFYDGLPEGDKAALFDGSTISFAASAPGSPHARRAASRGAVPRSGDDETLLGADVNTSTQLPTRSAVFRPARVVPAQSAQEQPLPLISGSAAALKQSLRPKNFPQVDSAVVYLEDTARVAGKEIITALTYPRAYLENGFDEARNEAQVFLQQAEEEATDIAMDAKRAGGVLVAQMGLGGLSRTLGNVYGDAQELQKLAADGRITPGEALKAIKLLGGVSLADILPADFPALGSDGLPSDQALTLTSDLVDVGLDTERLIITMGMTWRAGTLEDVPLLDVSNASLSLLLVSEVPTLGGSASWSVRGEFADFAANLIPSDDGSDDTVFVRVIVDKIIFSAGSGQTPGVDVDVKTIDFGGMLQLVKKLADYLPFGDGLSIDVDTAGIRAGLTLTLPQIALGAFTLSGVGVKTALTLPFGDTPVRFRFGMSGIEDPFSMTVMGLGGGGWFTNDLGLDGIERFEVAAFIEAKAAVDFGVASGGVSIKGGFQFTVGALEPGLPEGLEITAFVAVNGHVDVLGIASASIDIYIGQSVILPSSLPGDVYLKGRASCTVRVSVAFLSKSVTFEVERTFKGARIPDPTARSVRADDESGRVVFRDATSQSDWDAYCGAFA